jgi:hypothetical protein
MKFTPAETVVEAVWGLIKFAIVISSFFIFGWEVGALMIIISIDLK